MKPSHSQAAAVAITLLGTLAALAPARAASRMNALAAHDDCESGFVAFVGQGAYRFSPRHEGALAQVRLYTVLSYAEAAARGATGHAYWRLRIEGPESNERTFVAARGAVALDADGRARVEVAWNGHDERGRPVVDGKYRYTFEARFVPKGHTAGRGAQRYEDLDGRGADEAYASTREVVVDAKLSTADAQRTRDTLRMSACEVQQNTPLETGFAYNYYYGSLHSHSSYTDGGHPTSACSSSVGTGTFDPAAIYDFARNTAGMDFWGVIDHNHLFEDALASPDPAVVRQRYADGLAAAQAASQDGAFVGLWGMEWGVTTNSDQGHVTLLETPVLFGWEPCTDCNGPNPECTTGVDCYFDVFTPKRFGYLTLYQRSNDYPSPQGALGVFCHPSSGQFDNYAFDNNADQAIQGVAVRSGLAFTTATDCADTNVASTDYFVRWRDALSRGFHVGPAADHDAHCNNYGVAIPNRTVYLVPNNISPALTKSRILQAHKARHFFATEDANAQLVFATSDGEHIMGDIFSVGTSVSLRAAVYDPSNEAVSEIQLWRGQPGGAMVTTYLTRVLGQPSMTYTDNQTSGTYYYFIRAIQADGHDLWSSPMWVTFGAACTPEACDDGNPCTVDACDAGGACTHTPAGDGTSCSDGDACNGSETCQSGTCTAGAPLVCNDGNPCTVDSCDAVLGCTTASAENGTSCSDGDACNGQETCQSGVCSPGAPVDCNDGNPCTSDSCEPLSGNCANVPVGDGTSCSDGDACNGDETCQLGFCAAGTALTCSDANACTADSCDPGTGCLYVPIVDGTSCGDGNACNGAETCQSGACANGAPLDCDDGQECTADACDAALGCTHTNIASGTPCAGGTGTCNGSGACVPSVVTVFEDLFEETLAKWTETGTGALCWFVEPEAEKDVPGHASANKVAHADNCSKTKRLTMLTGVNTSAYSTVTLSFWRYVDNDLDSGEFLNVEVWNGASWVQLATWTHNAGDNDTWQQVSYDLTPYKNAALKVRFGAKMNSNAEEVEIDDVRIQGQ
jgi:hypothetical protein